MNQKLRTARGSIVIILTILCIVCLSLGLFFAAFSVSYAEESETNELPYYDNASSPNALWLVTYEGNEVGEPLISGSEITYVDLIDGAYVIVKDSEAQNSLTPFRGKALTLVINPDYQLSDGSTIGDAYSEIEYNGTNVILSGGSIDRKIDVITQVSLSNGQAEDEVLTVTCNWSIVPTSNAILNSAGNPVGSYVSGALSYLGINTYSEVSPEHGNAVVYSVYNTTSNSLVDMFAVDYTSGSARYYETDSVDNFDVATATPVTNNTSLSYLNAVLQTLVGGTYRLEVCVPAYQTDSVCYGKTTYVYPFTVHSYEFTPDKIGNGITISYDGDNSVQYNGQINNTPTVNIVVNGVTLVEGVDYVLESDQIDVGLATLRIVGQLGRLIGTIELEDEYYITQASNGWLDNVSPSILGWTYGTYNKENHIISGEPVLIEGSELIFSVSRDVQGQDVVLGLESFTAVDGIVADSIATVLDKLDVGTYYLRASVQGNQNYDDIAAITPFSVFKGDNVWTSEPKFNVWIQGQYDETENAITAAAKYGKVSVLVRDMDGNKYYEAVGDSVKLNNLAATKKNTTYILTIKVQGTANYNELAIEPIVFEVLPFGLPWWLTMIIVLVALGIVALVFCILHQKGVLQMLTGKVILAMRTRANVDATIAAVRAAKVARDAEASIAAAKAREAEEANNAQK